MQAAGDELLAGAVGTQNEHAGIRGSHFPDHILDTEDGLGLSDHLLPVDALAEDFVLLHEGAFLGGVLDGNEDTVQVEGLFNKIKGAPPHALHGRLDVAVAGDHHDRRLDSVLDQFGEHLHAVHSAGHLDVAEQDVVLLALGHLDGVRSVLRRIDRMVFHLQKLLQGAPDIPFVVNYQNFHTFLLN